MAYLLAIAFTIGGLLGGYGVDQWNDYRNAAHERQQAEAQAEVDAELVKLRAEAATKVDDMAAAESKGRKQAEARQQANMAKGTKNVTTYPVFSNPQCVLPPDVLLDLNRARAAVRSAPDTGGSPAGVSAPPAALGRGTQDALPADAP